MQVIFLLAVVVFFALNMGASGIAPSFAAAYGGKLIRKKNSLLLFGLFVIIGSIVLGRNVSITLGKSLLPKELLNPQTALIILISASVSLFLANILKIPQSTSQVTVTAITGIGLSLGFKQFNWDKLWLEIIPMWIVLPLLSYILTFTLYKIIYPPRRANFHLYEKIFTHGKKIKFTSLLVSCYVAFSIGTNNVANAVGPLYGAGLIGIFWGLLLISPLFSVGALLIGKGPLETAGKEIVPLGLVSSTIVSFVTATLLIFASSLGIPQSLVQLNLASIFAVGCLKNGHKHTLDQHIAKKTFFVWIITPIISLGIAYGLARLFLK